MNVQLRLSLVLDGHESKTWVSMSGPLHPGDDWGGEAGDMARQIQSSVSAHGVKEELKRELESLQNA